jgi:hypothetical protein
MLSNGVKLPESKNITTKTGIDSSANCGIEFTIVASKILRDVVVGRAWIVVEHPSCVLRAARLVPQSTDLFLCAVPERAHPAMLLVLLPQLRVDMPLAVDWSHELIAMPSPWETPWIEQVRAEYV